MRQYLWVNYCSPFPSLKQYWVTVSGPMFDIGLWRSGDHRRRTGTLQSRKEYHSADLQPTHSMWEISPAPARPLPCLHTLQEGLRQGLACRFEGNYEEVRHHCQPYPSHQNLCDKATNAVLFNIFLETIMTDALEDHEGTVSIGGRTITSLRLLMTSMA